jgi:hypothetical protein
MSNSINPGSIHLGGDVPQYYAEYFPVYDSVNNPKPPSCAIPEGTQVELSSTELLPINEACVFQFPDVTPIPPVYNPPYIAPPSCLSFTAESKVKAVNAAKNSSFTLTAAGPSNCGVILDGQIDVAACEDFTATTNITFAGAARNTTTNTSSIVATAASLPHCGIDITGTISVDACETFTADASKLTFSGAAAGSFMSIESSSTPNCGFVIDGNINVAACQSFDANVDINVHGSAVKKSLFSIVPSSRPDCGFTLKGDVEINACPSFNLQVIQGHSPKVTVKDYNGTFLSSATITSALTITGTECEKFLKLDFTDIVIDIPPASYYSGGGGGTTYDIKDTRIDIKTIGGESSRLWTATFDGPYLFSSGKTLKLSGTLSPPYFGCGEEQTDDGDMAFRTIKLEELDVTKIKKNSCCALDTKNEINLCDGNLFMTCVNQANPNVIDLCGLDTDGIANLNFSGDGFLSYQRPEYSIDIRPYHLRVDDASASARNYASLEVNYGDAYGGTARLNIQNNASYSTQLAGYYFYQGDGDANYIRFPGPDAVDDDFRIVISNDDAYKTTINGRSVYTGKAEKNANLVPGEVWIKQSATVFTHINGATIYAEDDTDSSLSMSPADFWIKNGASSYTHLDGTKIITTANGETSYTSIEPADIYVLASSTDYTRIQATNTYITSSSGGTAKNTSLSPGNAYFKNSDTDYTYIDGGTIKCNYTDGSVLTFSSNDIWLKDSDTIYTHLDAGTIYTQLSASNNSSITPGKATIKKAAGDYTDIEGATVYVGNGGTGAGNQSVSIGIALGAHVEVTNGTTGGKLSGDSLFVNSGTNSATLSSTSLYIEHDTSGSSTLGISSLTLSDGNNTGGYYTSSLSLASGTNSTTLSTDTLYIEHDTGGACTLGISSLTLSDGNNTGGYYTNSLSLNSSTNSATLNTNTLYIEHDTGGACTLGISSLTLSDGNNTGGYYTNSLSLNSSTNSATLNTDGLTIEHDTAGSSVLGIGVLTLKDSSGNTATYGTKKLALQDGTKTVDYGVASIEYIDGNKSGKLLAGELWVKTTATDYTHIIGSTIYSGDGGAAGVSSNVNILGTSGSIKASSGAASATLSSGNLYIAGSGGAQSTLGTSSLTLSDGNNTGGYYTNSLSIASSTNSATLNTNTLYIEHDTGGSCTLGTSSLSLSDGNNTGGYYTSSLSLALGTNSATLNTNTLYIEHDTGGACTLGISSLSLSDGTNTGSYYNNSWSVAYGTKSVTASAETSSISISTTGTTTTKTVLSYGNLTVHDGTNKAVLIPDRLTVNEGTKSAIYKATGVDYTDGTLISQLYAGHLYVKSSTTNFTHIQGSTIYAGDGGVAGASYNVNILGTSGSVEVSGATSGGKLEPSSLSVYSSATVKSILDSGLLTLTSGTTSASLGTTSLTLQGAVTSNYNLSDFTINDSTSSGKYVSASAADPSISLGSGGKVTKLSFGALKINDGTNIADLTPSKLTLREGTKSSEYGATTITYTDGALESSLYAGHLWVKTTATDYTHITGSTIYAGNGSTYNVNITGTSGKIEVQSSAQVGSQVAPNYIYAFNTSNSSSAALTSAGLTTTVGSAHSTLGTSSLSLSNGTDTGNYYNNSWSVASTTNSITATASTPSLIVATIAAKSTLKQTTLTLGEGTGLFTGDYSNAGLTVRTGSTNYAAISTASPNITLAAGNISSTLGTSSLTVGVGTTTGSSAFNIADWHINASANSLIAATASSDSNIAITAAGIVSTLKSTSLKLGENGTNVANYNTDYLTVRSGTTSYVTATAASGNVTVQTSSGHSTLAITSLSFTDNTDTGNYNLSDLTLRKSTRYISADAAPTVPILKVYDGTYTGSLTAGGVSLASSAGSMTLNSGAGTVMMTVGAKSGTLSTDTLTLGDGTNTATLHTGSLSLASAGKAITLDASALPSSASFQQVTICVDGVNKTAWVLMTTPA